MTGTLSEKLFSYLEVSGLVRSPFWEQIINLGIQEFGLQLQDFNGGPFRELPRWIAKGSYALWLLVLFAASVANASLGSTIGAPVSPMEAHRGGSLGDTHDAGASLWRGGFFYLL